MQYFSSAWFAVRPPAQKRGFRAALIDLRLHSPLPYTKQLGHFCPTVHALGPMRYTT
jgi:hypothetical protein